MYDIVIIGGGPAGMSAAIYAARGGARTVMLEKLAYGGQVMKTHEIDNYPGFTGKISGEDLSSAMERHASDAGAELVRDGVKSIENADGDIKIVRTRKNKYVTKAIILATGASPKKLNADGEERLTGAGVSYCATCDGAFFKDRDVCVIGGGNTAMEDALYLAGLCGRVYVLNRSKNFRARATLVDRAKRNGRIKILTDAVAQSFNGETRLNSVSVKNTRTGETDIIKASGAIIAIGVEPRSELAESIGAERCPLGFIKTDMYLATSVRGVFAAGDVRVSPLRQAVTAAADGAVAAVSAINYVNELGIKG